MQSKMGQPYTEEESRQRELATQRMRVWIGQYPEFVEMAKLKNHLRFDVALAGVVGQHGQRFSQSFLDQVDWQRVV